jgi:hypothetical protein
LREGSAFSRFRSQFSFEVVPPAAAQPEREGRARAVAMLCYILLLFNVGQAYQVVSLTGESLWAELHDANLCPRLGSLTGVKLIFGIAVVCCDISLIPLLHPLLISGNVRFFERFGKFFPKPRSTAV